MTIDDWKIYKHAFEAFIGGKKQACGFAFFKCSQIFRMAHVGGVGR